MSNSIFRDDAKEDHDNDDDGDHNSDQEQLELRKDDEEFVDEDKKDEELVNITDDFLEKKQQQLGDGVSSTEDDENDGFRTPISLEHRIPVPTQCPPAPKKSFKRKFEGSSITEIIRSAKKAVHDQFMAFKKARQDDDALS